MSGFIKIFWKQHMTALDGLNTYNDKKDDGEEAMDSFRRHSSNLIKDMWSANHTKALQSVVSEEERKSLAVILKEKHSFFASNFEVYCCLFLAIIIEMDYETLIARSVAVMESEGKGKMRLSALNNSIELSEQARDAGKRLILDALNPILEEGDISNICHPSLSRIGRLFCGANTASSWSLSGDAYLLNTVSNFIQEFSSKLDKHPSFAEKKKTLFTCCLVQRCTEGRVRKMSYELENCFRDFVIRQKDGTHLLPCLKNHVPSSEDTATLVTGMEELRIILSEVTKDGILKMYKDLAKDVLSLKENFMTILALTTRACRGSSEALEVETVFFTVHLKDGGYVEGQRRVSESNCVVDSSVLDRWLRKQLEKNRKSLIEGFRRFLLSDIQNATHLNSEISLCFPANRDWIDLPFGISENGNPIDQVLTDIYKDKIDKIDIPCCVLDSDTIIEILKIIGMHEYEFYAGGNGEHPRVRLSSSHLMSVKSKGILMNLHSDNFRSCGGKGGFVGYRTEEGYKNGTHGTAVASIGQPVITVKQMSTSDIIPVEELETVNGGKRTHDSIDNKPLLAENMTDSAFLTLGENKRPIKDFIKFQNPEDVPDSVDVHLATALSFLPPHVLKLRVPPRKISPNVYLFAGREVSITQNPNQVHRSYIPRPLCVTPNDRNIGLESGDLYVTLVDGIRQGSIITIENFIAIEHGLRDRDRDSMIIRTRAAIGLELSRSTNSRVYSPSGTLTPNTKSVTVSIASETPPRTESAPSHIAGNTICTGVGGSNSNERITTESQDVIPASALHTGMPPAALVQNIGASHGHVPPLLHNDTHPPHITQSVNSTTSINGLRSIPLSRSGSSGRIDSLGTFDNSVSDDAQGTRVFATEHPHTHSTEDHRGNERLTPSIRKPIPWGNQHFLADLVNTGLVVGDLNWAQLWRSFLFRNAFSHLPVPSDHEVDSLCSFIEMNLGVACRAPWARDLLYQRKEISMSASGSATSGATQTSSSLIPSDSVSIPHFMKEEYRTYSAPLPQFPESTTNGGVAHTPPKFVEQTDNLRANGQFMETGNGDGIPKMSVVVDVLEGTGVAIARRRRRNRSDGNATIAASTPELPVSPYGSGIIPHNQFQSKDNDDSSRPPYSPYGKCSPYPGSPPSHSSYNKEFYPSRETRESRLKAQGFLSAVDITDYTPIPVDHPPPFPSHPNPYLSHLFKTKMCNMFPSGHCARGNTCAYSHCIEELRDVPNRNEEQHGVRASITPPIEEQTVVATAEPRSYTILRPPPPPEDSSENVNGSKATSDENIPGLPPPIGGVGRGLLGAIVRERAEELKRAKDLGLGETSYQSFYQRDDDRRRRKKRRSEKDVFDIL